MQTEDDNDGEDGDERVERTMTKMMIKMWILKRWYQKNPDTERNCKHLRQKGRKCFFFIILFLYCDTCNHIIVVFYFVVSFCSFGPSIHDARHHTRRIGRMSFRFRNRCWEGSILVTMMMMKRVARTETLMTNDESLALPANLSTCCCVWRWMTGKIQKMC